MAFSFRLGACLAILAALLHVTVATAPKTGPSSCQKTEFWYKDAGCCLPSGGPPKPPPPPPSDSDCPPTSHYWGQKQGCCVPRNPAPPNNPPPQCRKGWQWVPALRKCTHEPTRPNNPKPAPSPKPKPGHGGGSGGGGYGHNHGGYGRRSTSMKSRSDSLCPQGLDACRIGGLGSREYECIDASTDLESCGGCTSTGQGQDCTAIRGAWNVGCEAGQCAIYTCAGGYRLSNDRSSCIHL
ncbi:hypothetical protein PLEOSDRAFT_1088534 [Pleurotus ostreatus PC15]|uniref:Protein CPL1-like domain-containing protein n=1 Tax=Pleurotus ostreatus (strain PC15) TaxID=1137138 RepID=A0A067NRT8_PLEO1|nr:hypothetical protein PLEOSDRAFT_1088534 [Pleurotus ostreatus PC15]